jgi:Protein of unknown function (DUF2867)
MSAAYDLMPSPDWASTTTIAAPNATEYTPEQWARAIFGTAALPSWIKSLLALRAVAAALLRLPQADPAMLAVDRVTGDEAIIDTDDRHLHFVAAVGTQPGLVHVTTAVRLKGWRGRVYFVPVRLLHDPVTRSMMASAANQLAAGVS